MAVPRRADRWRVTVAAATISVLLVGAGRLRLLGPDRLFLLLVLGVVFVVCVVVLTRVNGAGWHVLVSATAFVAAAIIGIGAVNAYYGYYQSWSALTSDLSQDNGAEAAPMLVTIAHPGAPTRALSRPVYPVVAASGPGRLVSILMPGPISGVSGRQALVWLPPQYDMARFASRRFPVLMLLHGDPGSPRSWTNGLEVARMLDAEAAVRTFAPIVVVMPDVSGFRLQQCLDAPSGLRLHRYLVDDVPAALATQLRVDPPGSRWAVGGLSSGGFCAALLALQNPDEFGAAAVMDGYFHPDLTRSVRRRLFGMGPVPAVDDPTSLLAGLPRGHALPAFWIMAGTGNTSDYHDAISFASLVGQREDLRFLTIVGGKHTTPAWRRALPDLLDWAGSVLDGHPQNGQSSMRV